MKTNRWMLAMLCLHVSTSAMNAQSTRTDTATPPARVAPAPAYPRETLLAAAREIIGAARYATLVTNGLTGHPSARIVDPFAPDADFVIWIGTVASSRKVSELKKDPRVTLLYFNAPNQEFVTLQGRAMFVTDEPVRAAHWKEDWANFYKDKWRGRDYALIKVTVANLEVLAPRRGINNDPATWKAPRVSVP